MDPDVRQLQEQVEALSRRVDELSAMIVGSGSIVLAGKTLTVDESVSLSDITRDIADLQAEI